MRIYELKKDDSNLIKQLEGHTDISLKVIKLENKLISCSRDKTMKIWEKNEEDDYNCIKSIIISDNSGKNTNILQINENKLSSSVESSYIKFFDIKQNFEEITTIKDISVNWSWNSMEIFNENILLIGGSDNKWIYLIDINNYQIISNILKDLEIYSIIKLKNGNILIGCKNNSKDSIIEYKYDNTNLFLLSLNTLLYKIFIQSIKSMV